MPTSTPLPHVQPTLADGEPVTDRAQPLGRVTVDGLAGRLASARPPRLIDVRTPAEFEASHLEGAVNVPLALLSSHPERLAPLLSDGVVLICRSGIRAAQAESTLSAALDDLGVLEVLDGGMTAWESAGGALVRGRRRWDLERQVRLVAGSLVLTGVLGSLLVPGLQWLSAAVGAGLAAAALTNSCVMGALLARLPYNRGARVDLATVLAELSRDSTPS